MEILSGKHAEKIDIWLGGMSLSNYRDDAILSWFYNFDHIARAMPKNEFDELEHDVAHWRADQALESPCQNIGAKLVQSGQILPLFHNWLGLITLARFKECSLTRWGGLTLNQFG